MSSSIIRYKGATYRLAEGNVDVEEKVQSILPMVHKYLEASGVGTGEPEFDDATARAMADVLVHAILHDEIFGEDIHEHEGFMNWREQNYPKSTAGAGVYDIVMYLSTQYPGLFERIVDTLKPRAAEAIKYKGATYRLAVQGQELNPKQLADKIIMQAENTQKELNDKLSIAKQSLENAVSSDESESATERLSNILKEAESAYNQVWRLLYAMENFATTKPSNTEESKEESED